MLTVHPELVGASESHLFDEGVDRLFDNIESVDWERRFLRNYLTRDDLVDLIRDLCDGIFLHMRDQRKPSARLIVEKTPFGSVTPEVDLRRKLDCYPDARYIHLVRDPRAVARSSTRRWAHSVDDTARLWQRSVAAVKNLLSVHPGFRELRYEDLVADPVAVMQDLFSWLGVRSDESSIDAVKEAAGRQIERRSSAPEANVSSWRRDLSPSALFTIESIAGSLMAEHGYPLTHPEVPLHTRVREAARKRLRSVAFVRSAASRLRALGRGRAPAEPTPDALDRPVDEPLALLVNDVAKAVAAGDQRALRSYLADTCEVEVRLGAATQTAAADDGIRLLLDTSKLLFDEEFVGTTWVGSPARPVSMVWFRGTRGTGAPVEFAVALGIEGELVTRVALLGYGPD